ncbi:hypothetical protein WICPIJ_004024 [Wickerhamomyces pijperi]|uniref:Uncharacterized protein n=1 Tax=Wickerhamomyces pijperi TaxID=599730 RepID=A0A9P8Q614_WICPI|nr:hypothetical protein WICPIJ_004024 [Wickerhamomyces pijperi]
MALANHIAVRGIKPRGDDHQIRIKLIAHRHDHLSEGIHVVGIAHPANRPWDVHIRTDTFTGTDLIQITSFGPRVIFPQFEPVKGNVQHPWVVIEGLLCPVTMMHVPIHDDDSLHGLRVVM